MREGYCSRFGHLIRCTNHCSISHTQNNKRDNGAHELAPDLRGAFNNMTREGQVEELTKHGTQGLRKFFENTVTDTVYNSTANSRVEKIRCTFIIEGMKQLAEHRITSLHLSQRTREEDLAEALGSNRFSGVLKAG